MARAVRRGRLRNPRRMGDGRGQRRARSPPGMGMELSAEQERSIRAARYYRRPLEQGKFPSKSRRAHVCVLEPEEAAHIVRSALKIPR